MLHEYKQRPRRAMEGQHRSSSAREPRSTEMHHDSPSAEPAGGRCLVIFPRHDSERPGQQFP